MKLNKLEQSSRRKKEKNMKNTYEYKSLMNSLNEVEIEGLNLNDTFIRVDDTKVKITYKVRLSKLIEYIIEKSKIRNG